MGGDRLGARGREEGVCVCTLPACRKNELTSGCVVLNWEPSIGPPVAFLHESTLM